MANAGSGVGKLKPGTVRLALLAYSSSRYSEGTSSSGTSRVRTSLTPASPDLSTPETTPASNALPSSSNSSTLSESTLSTSDKPCRSPDRSPNRESGTLDENADRPRPRVLVFRLAVLDTVPLLFAFRRFFLAPGLLGAAVFVDFFLFARFCNFFAAVVFRLALFFNVEFFFFFFLLAIRAV